MKNRNPNLEKNCIKLCSRISIMCPWLRRCGNPAVTTCLHLYALKYKVTTIIKLFVTTDLREAYFEVGVTENGDHKYFAVK